MASSDGSAVLPLGVTAPLCREATLCNERGGSDGAGEGTGGPGCLVGAQQKRRADQPTVNNGVAQPVGLWEAAPGTQGGSKALWAEGEHQGGGRCLSPCHWEAVRRAAACSTVTGLKPKRVNNWADSTAFGGVPYSVNPDVYR